MAEGVERACDRCRERRVKCDKRHPACFRCEKLGKPCPGYDKKRKFVDEGVTLRKKYQGDESGVRGNGEEIAELSINSPQSTNTGTNTGSPYSSNARKRKDGPSQSTPDVPMNGLRAIQPKSGEDAQLFKPDPMLLPNITQPDPVPPAPSDMDIDTMLNDVLDYDPQWFDLEPASFYGKNNNSCGFIPNMPNIVDEVDKQEMRPNSDAFGTPLATLPGATLPGADGNLWATESQFHTSQIITDEREHEMAFLIRHFTESIGPWMDLFDCEKHFGQLVPLKALRYALLKNAIAAVAAKQLGRVKGNKPFVSGQYQQPATMEVIDDDPNIDWYYKGANYYDKAIMYSRMYLQALSGSLSNPPSPMDAGTLSEASSDDLLLAVSIFSMYESLDNAEAGWLQHLTGMKSLLSVVGPSPNTSHITTPITVGRRASFWNFARADYQAAFLNRTPTLLDTEDLSMWQNCGIQVTPAGTLYANPDKLKADIGHHCATVEVVAHTMLWILLRTMNYLSTAPQHSSARQALWDQLNTQLDAWWANLPACFQPCAQLRHPVSRRPSTAIGTTTNTRGISELFFSIPLCAATIQLYHFARILLLLNRPASSTPLSNVSSHRDTPPEAVMHAYEIIGIALGRPHPAVRVEMLLPLSAAGRCLEVDEERKVVIEVLAAIEKDTGCSTEARVGELIREWGWASKIAV